MSELYQRLSEASGHLVSRWSEQREEAAWCGIERRRQRRARTRAVTLATVVLAAVLGIFFWPRASEDPRWAKWTNESTSVPVVVQSTPVLRLDDGSEVVSLTAGTVVEAVERKPTVTRLRVRAGTARFQVAPQADRVFKVLAGNTEATVLGTVFTVKLQSTSVLLMVQEGRVQLRWPGGSVIVGPGEQHLVPQGNLPREATTALPSASSAGRDASLQPPASQPLPDWRVLAEQGNYRASYDRLTSQGPSAVRSDPGDLLLAADVTRLGGHPGEAVRWLRRVVDEYPGDSRAALAAFTLGRVYLDQLGQPHQAAEAFSRARRMAPGGALAEDALAREVEARSRAGDSQTARRLAEQYLKQYPQGRRAAAVRGHGGL